MIHNISVAISDTHEQLLETIIMDNLGKELLDADARCPHCHALGNCNKVTEILRWPQVLVLHFKRWDFDPDTLAVKKIDTPIEFNTYLTLPDAGHYHLRGIVEHHGRVGGCHYTAFVRDQNDAWYFCDDSARPSPRTAAHVLAAMPYILVYER